MKSLVALLRKSLVVSCGVSLILLAFALVFPPSASAQSPELAQGSVPEWAWMGGSNSVQFQFDGQPGVYGTEFQFADSNTPGSRDGAIGWTDRQGRLWLFGGFGDDFSGAYQGWLNDLWVFDPSRGTHGQWAWMAGSDALPSPIRPCVPAVYGTEFQFDPSNTPGGRRSGVSWIDLSGRLWLFGGAGCDRTGLAFILNDLWVFDPSQGANGEWAWMGGDNATGEDGAYGTEFQFSASNIPGAREGSAAWIDWFGRVFLFGGAGIDSSGNVGALNDLWTFDPSQGANGEWTWIGGASTIPITANGPSGVYGTEHEFAAANIPGGRSSAAIWTDLFGRFWLFGGGGIDSAGNVGDLNDLWVFNPYRGANGEWAWMGGSNTTDQPGAYGTEFQFSAANIPGEREGGATWTDRSGKLWLFGGLSEFSDGINDQNDVWIFDPLLGAHGEWAWMGGSNAPPGPDSGQQGIYGTEFQFAASNAPGSRDSALTWADPKGRLWLLGGIGFSAPPSAGYLNDLWELRVPRVR